MNRHEIIEAIIDLSKKVSPQMQTVILRGSLQRIGDLDLYSLYQSLGMSLADKKVPLEKVS